MFDLDKWQEIFNTIQKHKLRTFLTALGVFWGIFMLVFLMGAGKGLENGVTGLFGSHAKNSMYVWTQRTSLAYKGFAPGRFTQLTLDDINALRDRFSKEIAYIAPRMWLPSGEITYKNQRAAFDVRGDAPDLVHIDAIRTVAGRFLNERDMNNKRKIAVIGREVKKVLFEDQDPLGEYIKIRGAEYRVVGVVASDRRGENALEDEKSIFIPITTAQQITNQPNEVGWFVCAMHPNISVSTVEPRIISLLKERLTIAPDDPQGIGTDNVEEEFQEIMGLFTGIRLLVWFVGIGSLVAGVIGVGNIMLIIVKERTKEIGIRKALGATPRSIVSMILLESVFITTLAGYMGLAFSTGIIFLMNLATGEGSEYFTNPEIDFPIAIAALIVLVISGALTGLIPALQAARVNPVVALKDE